MTSSVQKSVFTSETLTSYNLRSHRRRAGLNSYQATVEDFDGCEYEYNIEAESYEAAAAIVEMRAANSNIQVYNINIYLICY